MHIRTTIQDALRTLDPLPRSLRAKGKEIDRVAATLAHHLSEAMKSRAAIEQAKGILIADHGIAPLPPVVVRPTADRGKLSAPGC